MDMGNIKVNEIVNLELIFFLKRKDSRSRVKFKINI